MYTVCVRVLPDCGRVALWAGGLRALERFGVTDFGVLERRLSTTGGSLRRLAEAIERIEGTRRPRDGRPVASGFAALDRLLPEGGFHRGAIVEYLSAGGGSAAASLALATARSAMLAAGGVLLVVDRERTFYPPAAAAWGISLDRLILAWPDNDDDERWTLDQALRSPAVAAVLAWPADMEGNDFRRWQLAAEAGGSLGLFVRPDAVRGEPSWAEARLAVSPLAVATTVSAEARPAASFPPSFVASSVPHRVLRVELLKCRGRAGGSMVEVAIDDATNHATNGATHPVPVAKRLVASTPRRARA